MNARIALIFVVLLAVLGGAAIVYYQQEGSRRPENVGTLGKNLREALKQVEPPTAGPQSNILER